MNWTRLQGSAIKNMQPGQAFHANYAASYKMLKDFRVGFQRILVAAVNETIRLMVS